MAGGLTGVVQAENVVMLQARSVADLLEKLLDSDSAHRLRGQHLDGHLSSEFHVAGEVDCAHAPLADLLVHQVTVSHGRLEARIRPSRRVGVDLEQIVERYLEDFQHPLPGLGRRMDMLPIHDL